MSREPLAVRQVAGPARIHAALEADLPMGLVLVLRDSADSELRWLANDVRARGVPLREVSARVLERVSHAQPAPSALGLVGRDPRIDLEGLLAGRGCVWLLARVAYPGNAGMVIRTAEVSGADGIVIDCDFEHPERRFAVRTSMRSDWYMPTLWEPADSVFDRLAGSGRRVIAIEDVGTRAPWEVDLTGRTLFVVGGESGGIPHALLDRCDEIVRIPMRGFIPTYNLQAAVATIAVERLRQLDLRLLGR